MFALSVESFLRSLGVPRDLIGILNVKSHSRKEELFVQIRKINVQHCRPCLPHLRPWIYILQDRRILHSFLCSKILLALKNISVNVTTLKMSQVILRTGKKMNLPGQECTCLCQSRTQPLLTSTHSLRVKKAQTHSWAQSKYSHVTEKKQKNANKCSDLITFFPIFLPFFFETGSCSIT